MFLMRRVGQNISTLRRERNMTQMELADRMGVSFQAVSNWERGESMPDIAKLPELARMLGVTIDDLLGESAPLVEGLTQQPAQVYARQHPVSPESFVQAAPVLKPNQAGALFEQVQPAMDFGQVRKVLPFLGVRAVDAMLRRACEQGQWDRLTAFAPFASDEAVEAAYEASGQRPEGPLPGLLPFLRGERVDALIGQRYAQEGLSDRVKGMLPFATREELSELARRVYAEQGNFQGFGDLAPHVPGDTLAELALQALERGGLDAIAPILPFLDAGLLEQWVQAHDGP